MGLQQNRIKESNRPSIDDQMKDDSSILFYLFYFGSFYLHKPISEVFEEVEIDGYKVQISNETLLINGQSVQDYSPIFQAVQPSDYKVIASNRPEKDFSVSKFESAAIQINSEAVVFVHFNQLKQNYMINIFSNGEPVFFNGQKVEEEELEWNVSDQLVINHLIIELREKQFKFVDVGTKVHFDNFDLTEEPFYPEYPNEFPLFKRSPRILLKEPTTKIEIQKAKPKETQRKNELMRAIVPPLAMVVLSGATAVFSGRNMIMMLSMGGMSLITAAFSVSSYLTNKKEVATNNKVNSEKYKKYVIKTKGEVVGLLESQIHTLDYMYPSLDQLSIMTKEYSSRLYERMVTHEDFLKVKIGNGTIPTSFTIDSRLEDDDELNLLAEQELVAPYYELDGAPIVIPTVGETIGLVGETSILRTAVQLLFFQLAVMQSYHDVEFIALIPEDDYAAFWYDWRWLPHLKLHHLNLRGLVHSAQTKDMIINSFYQTLSDRIQAAREAQNTKIYFQPHYIFTVIDESWLEGHRINELLAEDLSEYGVTVIWAKESLHLLPDTITTLIEYQSSEYATLVNQNSEYVNQVFVPVHPPTAYPIASAIQRLANLQHVEVEKNLIPEEIDFLGLYEVQRVEDLGIAARWNVADTSKSLAVPLGLRGKDDVVYLNLHEKAHGPHGLVAGTTGSGKSEIVQSYMLSLAVNFPPEDVGFLPIDFKGGGMANLFKDLPHLLGSITNLDGASSARALQSIRAELQKRQREFSKFGVNHINGYTKLYKQGKSITDLEEKHAYPSVPLPHLFLISDEFAELKANEPEFMAELVSIARIGRSLGVHLILATQKPSGVVDDQIWSNSRFKLALKVADTNDSNEIIKTPDAASITQVGRAYLQVGNNEIYELFQSAWSGATYIPDVSKENQVDERIWLINQLGQYELLTTDLSDEETLAVTQDEMTQLDAIVKEINHYSEISEAVLPEKPWLPPLGTSIVSPLLEEAWQKMTQVSVPFGLMDRPSSQEQLIFPFNLVELSHTAFYGSPGFGKSTALQTLALNLARLNTPEQVQFNLFDFGTNGLLPLKEMPHVVDFVKLEEEEKLMKFLKRIQHDIQQRKELFTQYGVASIDQYEAKSGLTLPLIVTLIDGYDVVRESHLEEAIETVVNQLLREGGTVGLYVMLTALRTNTFKMSMSSNIPSHIVFYLVEDNAVRDIIGREALIPQAINGRAQIKLDQPYELQVFLPAEGDNAIDRLNHIEDEIAEMNRRWTGERPDGIPMLPKEVSLEYFRSLAATQLMLEAGCFPLALDVETTDPRGFIPHEHGYFVIADDTTDQTEAIERVLLSDLAALPQSIQRIVFNASERFTDKLECFDTIVPEQDYSQFMTDLISEVELRQTQDEVTPMVVYYPDAHLFSDKHFIDSQTIDRLLKRAPSVQIYFIFQADQRQLESGYDDFNQRLRKNPPAGMLGTRLADQRLINTKSHYSEPAVEVDESYYFVGRNATKVKLVNE